MVEVVVEAGRQRWASERLCELSRDNNRSYRGTLLPPTLVLVVVVVAETHWEGEHRLLMFALSVCSFYERSHRKCREIE